MVEINRIDRNGNPNGALPDFTVVFLTYQDRIYRHARKLIGGPPEDAEDITQTTFLNAWRAWRRLPPDANIHSWLYRIATNASFSALRKQALMTQQPWDDSITEFYIDHSGNGTPESEALRHESIQQARAVLHTLPPNYRLALVLREYMELPYQEIADTMHLHKGAAKSLLFRARERFIQKYQNRYEKDE